MQHLNTISEIKGRAEAIRLAVTRLGDMAGVARSTALARNINGHERDLRSSTVRKLSEALVAEELRLRDYLVGLHPIDANAPGVAA